MADLQQYDFSKLPDQYDFSKLPDKPSDAGKSHGWLADTLWNAGERVLDIGKGLLNSSPLGQMAQASQTLSTLDKNPHAFDSQIASVGQQLGNVTGPQYASALAQQIDPSGIVPSEIGLAKQLPSDIANKNVGGAAVNAGMMALPFLHVFGAKTTEGAPLPAQPETPIEAPKVSEVTPRQLPDITSGVPSVAHTPDSISARLDVHPDIASGTVIKPPPDVVNSTPVDPVIPSDVNIPRAGNAKPTPDVGPIKAELNGPNLELAKYPDTANIANALEEGQLQRDAFLNRNLQELSPAISGLSTQERITLGKIISAPDYGKVGTDIPGVTPDLLQRAEAIKKVMDEIHPLLTPPDPTKAVDLEGGEVNTVGYIQNYLSMIKKDTTNPIWKYYFGDTGDTTSGDVSSRFAQTRKGLLPEDEREFDVAKVLPAYVSSAARDIFLKPAITDASYSLTKIPTDSNRYELAKAYINNVSGYDNEPNLQRAWNQYANNAANMNVRAYTDWNVPLHILHATKLPGVMWPELGTKYSTIGLIKTLTDPINSWNEVTRNGLVKGNLVPNEFKTTGQRYQSIANFWNMAEQLATSVGYHGAKQQFLDQGMMPNDATMAAIKLTRKMNLTNDVASSPKFLTPESNWFGGAGGSKLVNQFKGPAMQLANFYYDALANAKTNPAKAARTIAAMTTLGYLGENHIGNLAKDSISFYTKMAKIGHALFVSHDIGKAVTATMQLVLPGGHNIPN